MLLQRIAALTASVSVVAKSRPQLPFTPSPLPVSQALSTKQTYCNVDDLFSPLKLMYDSLKQTGDDSIADARLLDLIRQARPDP